jgi:hypothetical protein
VWGRVPQACMYNAHFCALKFKYGVCKEVGGRAKEELLSLSATRWFLQLWLHARPTINTFLRHV